MTRKKEVNTTMDMNQLKTAATDASNALTAAQEAHSIALVRVEATKTAFGADPTAGNKKAKAAALADLDDAGDILAHATKQAAETSAALEAAEREHEWRTAPTSPTTAAAFAAPFAREARAIADRAEAARAELVKCRDEFDALLARSRDAHNAVRSMRHGYPPNVARSESLQKAITDASTSLTQYVANVSWLAEILAKAKAL